MPEWKLPDADEVIKRWRMCDQELIEARRDYWLNTSFYLAEQWVKWDAVPGQVQSILPTNDEEKRDRTTIDKYGPRFDSLHARMIRTDVVFQTRPVGTDDDALRRARTQDEILAGLYSRDNWAGTRSTEVQDTFLGGTAAVCVEYVEDDKREVVIDPITFMPIPHMKVRIKPLSVAEFGIEPGSRHYRDARWWISATTLTPEQAQDTYPDAFPDKPPQPDTAQVGTPLYRALFSKRYGSDPSNNTCVVYCYYERPTRRTPGGVVHVVGTKVVHAGPWPFVDTKGQPIMELNLAVFRQREISGRWYGDTLCSSARSPQIAYNRARSCIQVHIDRASTARHLIPEGSLPEGVDNTDDPGDPWLYNSEISGEPHWEQAPQVPRYLREEPGQLEAELDDIFHTHAVTRGQAPGDRNAARALALLAEKDDTPLGRMARDQQLGWQDIGSFVLRAVRVNLDRKGEGDRLTVVSKSGNPIEVTYGPEDIDREPDVHVPLESVQPRSRAATQAAMVELQTSFPQLFEGMTPNQVATLLLLDDPIAFLAGMSPDERAARWENEMIEAGEVLEPQEFEDHLIHNPVHYEAMKAPSFRFWPPERQEALRAHVEAHDALQQEKEAEDFAKAQEQAARMQQLNPGGIAPPGMEGGPPLNGEQPMEPPPPDGQMMELA